MKKLFITLLLFCFYVTQGAHGAMIIQQFTSGGGECSATPTVTCASNADGTAYNTGGTIIYLATKFTASASGTICSVRAYAKDMVGTGDKNVYAEIWTDVSDDPGAIIGTASDGINIGSIGTSFTYVTFENIEATGITSSTDYWIVWRTTGTSNNSFGVERNGTDCTPEHIVNSTDGSTWSDNSTGRSLVYDVYYTE